MEKERFEDGGKIWTKTFNDVPEGEYTVTETNALIDGYKLKEAESTTEATAEVKDGDKATAEITDEYEKEEEASPDDEEEKDDDKPSKGVDTGDDTPLTTWIALMLTSLAGLAASVFTRRRSDRK